MSQFTLEFKCPVCGGWMAHELDHPPTKDDMNAIKNPCHSCQTDTQWQEAVEWLMGPNGFVRGYGNPDDDNPLTPEG